MDYFSYARRRGNNPVTQDRLNAPLPPTQQTPGPQTPGPQTPGAPGTPGGRRLGGPPSLEGLRAPSSIRIRRLPSGLGTPRPGTQQGPQSAVQADTAVTGRRRSSSEPQRYGSTLAPPGVDMSRQRTHEMPTLREETPGVQQAPSGSSQSFHDATEAPQPETPRPYTPSINIDDTTDPAERVVTGASAMQDAGNAAREHRGLRRFRTASSAAPRNETPAADEYGSDVVDLLDLVGMLNLTYKRLTTSSITNLLQTPRFAPLVL